MSKYKRSKTLTLPIVSMAHNDEMYIKVVGPMYKVNEDEDENGKKRPMTLVPIIDLESGEEMLLICHTLISAVFKRDAKGYVGKCYELSTGPDIPGKNYRNINMYEIDCEAE